MTNANAEDQKKNLIFEMFNFFPNTDLNSHVFSKRILSKNV